jgi:hypothetical protein
LDGQVTIVNPSIYQNAFDHDRTKTSVFYDLDSRVIYGSIYLDNNVEWSQTWCLRSRQIGPPGDQGVIGESKLQSASCTIADDAMLATCPIVTLRADCGKQTLYWTLF